MKVVKKSQIPSKNVSLAGYADNLDIVCKRNREVKDNTKVLSQSDWENEITSN